MRLKAPLGPITLLNAVTATGTSTFIKDSDFGLRDWNRETLALEVTGTRSEINCTEAPGHPAIDCRSVLSRPQGHATIYLWRCDGPRPIASQSALRVDERGFTSQNWKRGGSE